VATSDQEFIQRAVRVGIITLVAGLVLIALLWVLKSALTPLAAAFILAYLLDPVIDRFEAHRIPRPVAIFALLGLIGAAVATLLIFLVPRMQEEVTAMATKLPGYLQRASAEWLPWIEQTLHVDLREGAFTDLIGKATSGFAIPLETVQSMLQTGLGYVAGTVGAVVGVLVIPVIAYYFLVDFDRIRRRIVDYVPRPYVPWVTERAQKVDELVAGFIRGQLTVCLILSILYAAGFTIIGIDLALLIGMTAGFLAIIPYVGNAVAVISASAVCMLEFGVDVHLALVLGWYAIVQTLEGFVLTPKIVGGTLGLHPVTVIVALLIGGDLLGFLGLLIAVPVAAVLQVFVAEILQHYRASKLYHGKSG
jgi:predicted PurR-regulated permease PerM